MVANLAPAAVSWPAPVVARMLRRLLAALFPVRGDGDGVRTVIEAPLHTMNVAAATSPSSGMARIILGDSMPVSSHV